MARFEIASRPQRGVLGHRYDMDLGRDPLTQVQQWIRVECTAVFDAPDHVRRARFKAIGGGPTNVPRWSDWPTFVRDLDRLDGLVRSGQLVPVTDDARPQDADALLVEVERRR